MATSAARTATLSESSALRERPEVPMAGCTHISSSPLVPVTTTLQLFACGNVHDIVICSGGVEATNSYLQIVPRKLCARKWEL